MAKPPPSTEQQDGQAIAEEFKEYAYLVSHDLGAPLRAMVEFSKILHSELADDLSEEQKEYFSLVIDGGQKMQAMMDALLTYSRLNTTAKPFCAVNCNELLEGCQISLKEHIDRSGAKLHIAKLPTVTADADQLRTLFTILLDNALQFQPAGNTPEISVTAEEKGQNWAFHITDNGIGIAASSQERVFTLFRRLHPDGEYRGVGAGLGIAKKIIQRHGGDIFCTSTPEAGSTFTFTLPRTRT